MKNRYLNGVFAMTGCSDALQFSPASEHILLAYGRRHSSLLRSIVVNGTTSIPIFTILEVRFSFT